MMKLFRISALLVVLMVIVLVGGLMVNATASPVNPAPVATTDTSQSYFSKVLIKRIQFIPQPVSPETWIPYRVTADAGILVQDFLDATLVQNFPNPFNVKDAVLDKSPPLISGVSSLTRQVADQQGGSGVVNTRLTSLFCGATIDTSQKPSKMVILK